MSGEKRDADIDKGRRHLDASQTERRAGADSARLHTREETDRTRPKVQGDTEQVSGFVLERERNDEALREERDHSDEARSKERQLGDVALAREKQTRAVADESLEERVQRDARRNESLREALALVESEIQVVAGSLTQLLAAVPRGTFDGRLSGGVEKIRLASVRMQRLLEDALDPGDTRRRYHEVGGSG